MADDVADGAEAFLDEADRVCAHRQQLPFDIGVFPLAVGCNKGAALGYRARPALAEHHIDVDAEQGAQVAASEDAAGVLGEGAVGVAGDDRPDAGALDRDCGRLGLGEGGPGKLVDPQVLAGLGGADDERGPPFDLAADADNIDGRVVNGLVEIL